jgi:Icc protein
MKPLASRRPFQIEEGPVGYSVTNIDGDIVSWRFVELGNLPVVVITSPSDERLLTRSNEMPTGKVKARAKVWGEAEAVHGLLGTQLGPNKNGKKW